MKFQPNKPIKLALTALVFFSLVRAGQAGFWTTNSPLNVARYNHTATLLPNGTVLIAGGQNSSGATATAEIYNPATGSNTLTAPLNFARWGHTATLLTNGTVLVTGGQNAGAYLANSEIYDPAAGTWTPTGPLNTGRYAHTATLLYNGQVLVAGGYGAGSWLSSAELYDPTMGTWTVTSNALTYARGFHTAALLTNGLVFVAGGQGTNGVINSTETFNPINQTWKTNSNLAVFREYHTATLLTNGLVLLAGGHGTNSLFYLTSMELYNPATGTTASAAGTLNSAHERHTATLLPNGKVLLVDGLYYNNPSSNVEYFDPFTTTNTTTSPSPVACSFHTATLLPGGRVFVAGGLGTNGALNQTETYDYAGAIWTNTTPLTYARAYQNAAFLPNSTVLIAGGANFSGASGIYPNPEIYSYAAGTWTVVNSTNTARRSFTLTLLPNGKILAAGGLAPGTTTNCAELYDPATGKWTRTNAMSYVRANHTATLLHSGKVLVTGGSIPDTNYINTNSGISYINALSSSELFDPATGTWAMTGPLNTARSGHTATLLPDGRVLVAGGDDSTNGVYTDFSSAEIYDPLSGTWSYTSPMQTNRVGHKAILLPSGNVLVTGGVSASNFLASSELFDPHAGTWTYTGSMSTNRSGFTTTLLPDGRVLVAGGENQTGWCYASAELYDPGTGAWTTLASLMNSPRVSHTATLLPNGKVLLAGGFNNQSLINVFLSSAELYDPGLTVTQRQRLNIVSVTSPLALGSSLVATGAQFRGFPGSSSGNSQDSATGYPLLQLRSLEGGQMVFVPATSWTTNTFSSAAVWNFPPGYALATLFVNGIQSTSAIVNLTVPVPSVPVLTNLQTLNGLLTFGFTNSSGAAFGVLASTDATVALTNWTRLGAATETAPGQFQFTDPQASNAPQQFYRVFSP